MDHPQEKPAEWLAFLFWSEADHHFIIMRLASASMFT